jgi:hypothetical protein
MGAFLDDDCCLDDSPDSRSLGVRIRCRYRLEGNLKMLYLFIKQMYRYTQTCQLARCARVRPAYKPRTRLTRLPSLKPA